MSGVNPLEEQIRTTEQDSIIYSLNEQDRTASVLRSNSKSEHITIPRSIIHKDQEYIITRILKFSFSNSNDIKSLDFPINSEINQIEENAFFNSSLERLQFPPSLSHLDDGWCQVVTHLTEIKISEQNPLFAIHENGLLLGKTASEGENFDVLVFCPRNARSVTVPSFVETIAPYAFDSCNDLESVTFPADSKLRKFSKFSFCGTPIRSISIPKTVTDICEHAFFRSNLLRTIDIDENCELETIEKGAFSMTSIESFTFPSKLRNLRKGWCSNTKFLKTINVSQNNRHFVKYGQKLVLGKSSSEKVDFDVLVFCCRDVEDVTIPSFVEVISSYAFNKCSALRSVKVLSDSKLRKIKSSAFYMSAIETLMIPPNLVEVGNTWIGRTMNLKSFVVSPQNKNFQCLNDAFLLRKSSSEKACCDVLVAAARSIKEAVIPSTVEAIDDLAFCDCVSLRRIVFTEDSRLRTIGTNALSLLNLKQIILPPHLTKIGFDAFSMSSIRYCGFMQNSELEEIDINGFNGSNLEYFVFPKSVTRAGDRAFYVCRHLRYVEVPDDSELEIIERECFAGSTIGSFRLPPHAKKLGKGILKTCDNLKIVEIPENSEWEEIDPHWLTDSPEAFVMIPVSLKDRLTEK